MGEYPTTTSQTDAEGGVGSDPSDSGPDDIQIERGERDSALAAVSDLLGLPDDRYFSPVPLLEPALNRLAVMGMARSPVVSEAQITDEEAGIAIYQRPEQGKVTKKVTFDTSRTGYDGYGSSQTLASLMAEFGNTQNVESLMDTPKPGYVNSTTSRSGGRTVWNREKVAPVPPTTSREKPAAIAYRAPTTPVYNSPPESGAVAWAAKRGAWMGPEYTQQISFGWYGGPSITERPNGVSPKK